MLTLKDLIRRARSRLDDENSNDYLWSRHELLDCINDTVRDAAIRANLKVEDDLEIPFVQNADLTWKAKYPLPNGILNVNSVYLLSQPGITLKRNSFGRLDQLIHRRPTLLGTPLEYTLDQTQPGTGEEFGIFIRTITFLGAPIKTDTAVLQTVRLPNLLEFDDDVPEFDDMYHPDLIPGITGLAYLKKDADTFDPKRSARDLQLFEDRFGFRLPAVVLRDRQTQMPLEMIVG